MYPLSLNTQGPPFPRAYLQRSYMRSGGLCPVLMFPRVPTSSTLVPGVAATANFILELCWGSWTSQSLVSFFVYHSLWTRTSVKAVLVTISSHQPCLSVCVYTQHTVNNVWHTCYIQRTHIAGICVIQHIDCQRSQMFL